jgi:hypothetical protein
VSEHFDIINDAWTFACVGTFRCHYWCLNINISASEHFDIINYAWTFACVGIFRCNYWCLNIRIWVSERFGTIKDSTFMFVLEQPGTVIDARTFISECRNILVSLMMLEHLCLSLLNGFN